MDDRQARISNLPHRYSHGNRVHDATRRSQDLNLVPDGDSLAWVRGSRPWNLSAYLYGDSEKRQY